MDEREIIEATVAGAHRASRSSGRCCGPITLSRLQEDLNEMGVEPGIHLLVHSSLSSVGWVCGGVQAVVQALEEVVRPYGTLVMPAHSPQVSDPSGWTNPSVPESWWETIRETMPAFDPDLTPTRGMGVIAESFRSLPDTLRSSHPQVSFSARGEGAVGVTENHGIHFSLGEHSPLARLYDADAWVLFLGVGYAVNTSFHLAEYRADFAGKREVDFGAPITVDGHRRWKWFRDLDISANDFSDIGKAFEKKYGREIRHGRVGLADSRLFRVRSCVDYAVRWMEMHRRG